MEKIFVINGEELRVQDYSLKDGIVNFSLKGKTYSYRLVSKDGTELILESGSRIKASVSSPSKEGESIVMTMGREALLNTGTKKVRKGTGQIGGLISPMPGKIFKILKEVGSEVKKGETILVLEAMKMEHTIRSDKDGKVKKIPFKAGELVQANVVLAEVE
jgi:biotin carboxyl carrier protein